MDELKKYLQGKKEELDIETPAASVWEKIRTDLKPLPAKAPVISTYRKWIAIAAALLIAIAAFFAGNLRKSGVVKMAFTDSNSTLLLNALLNGIPKPRLEAKDIQPAIPTAKTMDTVRVVGYSKNARVKSLKIKTKQAADPVESFEASYASLVNDQLKQLRKLPVYVSDPGYFGLFRQQFTDLEKEEILLKKTIRKDGVTEESLDGLVMLYQQKIKILRTLQSEISRSNAKVREHTAEKDLKPTYIIL